ncbi:hypothetical protein ACTFIZ_009373 [Dictyostelium cf. discoideum]
MNFVKSSLTKVRDTTHQIGAKLDSFENKPSNDTNIITDAYAKKNEDEDLSNRATEVASNTLPTNSNLNSSSSNVQRKKEGEGLLNRVENTFSKNNNNGDEEEEEERVGQSQSDSTLSEKKDGLLNKFQNSMKMNDNEPQQQQEEEEEKSESNNENNDNTSPMKRNKGGLFNRVGNEVESFGRKNENKNEDKPEEQNSSSFDKRNEHQQQHDDEDTISKNRSQSSFNKNEGFLNKVENKFSSITGRNNNNNNNDNEDTENKTQDTHSQKSSTSTTEPGFLNKIHNYNKQVETNASSALNFIDGKSSPSNPTPTSTPNISSSNENSNLNNRSTTSSTPNERGFFSEVEEKVDGFFKGNQTKSTKNNNQSHNEQTNPEPKKEGLLSRIGKF